MTSRSTSQEANQAVDKHTLRNRVFQVLLDYSRRGGLTCDELEQELGLTHQSCSPRLTELSEICWIYDSGARRPTRSGRNAIVWLPIEDPEERRDLQALVEGALI